MKAYQIVNFNNPVSVKYLEHSLKSFEPVKDILEIEPVQCFTPETLPTDNVYKDKKTRTVFEQACFASHYSLVKRLSIGEKFIIMEHDAYLWPDRIDVFYTLMNNIDSYAAFYLGIANEFYTFKIDIAKRYVSSVNNRRLIGGPMTTAMESIKFYEKASNGISLWPVIGQKKKLGQSHSVIEAAGGKGITYPAPVTQHFMAYTGSTIRERANNWKSTPEKNPDMYFTYE